MAVPLARVEERQDLLRAGDDVLPQARHKGVALTGLVHLQLAVFRGQEVVDVLVVQLRGTCRCEVYYF